MTAAKHIIPADPPLPMPSSTDRDGGAVWSLDSAVGAFVWARPNGRIVCSPGSVEWDVATARRFIAALQAAVAEETAPADWRAW